MQFESHLTLSGVVTHALHLPGKPDLLLVLEDGASPQERPGSIASAVPSVASRNGSSRAHTSTGKLTAESATGHAVARNVILLLCQGDWALSCSFVEAGDRVEISRFSLQQHEERRLDPPPLRFAGADGGFAPPAASTATSNAPGLLAFASAATKAALPRTTLCITPSSATEMIVNRRKRVVINFANVGNLTLLDMTDKELQQMEANHLRRLEPLQAPLHHQQPPSPSPVIHLIEASPRAHRISQREGGSPKSHPKAALITAAAAASLRSAAAAPSADAIPSIGVAGKNCYAAMDRYYDVVYGQSAQVHPNVAFIERVVGGNTGHLLDAGSGSGLYAFTLRALGARNITCLDKSLTMLRMLEEKNLFHSLVEGDLPDRQRKGQVRSVAGDVCTFRLPRVDPSTGEEGFEDFTTVLCLQVLSHLPDLASVQQALFTLSLHTAVGGQLLASIPNADVVVRKGHHQSHHRYTMERAANTMCAGATTAMANGVLDIIQQVLIREPQRHVSADPSSLHPSRRALELVDGIARRETTFHGTAFHPDAPSEEGLFVPFREQVTELLISGAQFEQAAASVGFCMEGLYGSLSGAPFSATESEERVYVFRRREDQFGVPQSS